MADEDQAKQDAEGGEDSPKDVVSRGKYLRETKEYQEAIAQLKAELSERDKQLADITAKAQDAEGLQKALEEAKAASEKFKADSQAREAAMRRDFALDTKLSQMGARNLRAARALIDLDKVSVGEDGEVAGVDFDAIKTENAYLFADQQRFATGGTPKGGAGQSPLADFRSALGLKDKE